MTRAIGGDVSAYEELVRDHQDAAFRAAYAVCRDRSDAEEATQEAFMKAHRALHRFRPGAPFRPWLLAIVGNEARNRIRTRVRHQRLADQAAQGMPATAARSAETAALERSDRDELRRALASLEARDRQVIELRYFVGLDEREMAAALGCRAGTVKSRLSRAMSRLRAVLGDANV